MAGVTIVVRVGRVRKQGTLLRSGKPLNLRFATGEDVIIACHKGKPGPKKTSSKNG